MSRFEETDVNFSTISSYHLSRIREHGMAVHHVPGGVVNGRGDVHLQLIHGGLEKVLWFFLVNILLRSSKHFIHLDYNTVKLFTLQNNVIFFKAITCYLCLRCFVQCHLLPPMTFSWYLRHVKRKIQQPLTQQLRLV